MRFWPNRKKNQNRIGTEIVRCTEQIEQEAAKRRILAEAARQRRERDRTVPPEHRAGEAERRRAAAGWNQPTRWYESAPLTLGQRCGYQARAALSARAAHHRWAR